jgi:hypothetical protein
MESRLSGSRCIRGKGGTSRAVGAVRRLLAAPWAVVATAGAAHAHGFGERYDLPLPLSFYLYGTAAIVAATFMLVGLFVRHVPKASRDRRLDLLARPIGRILGHRTIVFAIKLVSLVLFATTIAAGFLGNQNPYRNIAPTMVWIIVWVGFAYVAAFVGDLWAFVNPWRTAFEWAEWGWRRLGGRDLSLGLSYPVWLGVWPAVVLLLAFAWIELIYPTPAVPAQLSCLAIAYSVLTWAGMVMFGRETWLRQGEVFTVTFGVYARFAPTEACADAQRSTLFLRPFGAGLLGDQAASPSMTAFVVLLLATVLFDGFLNTPGWAAVEGGVGAFLGEPGEFGRTAIRTVGLVLFWLLLLGAYLLVSALASGATGRRLSPQAVARRFAFTLVPIAIGYHVAHYLGFLLIQGQYIIPQLSDPFGAGWNLFGTAGYRVDIGIVGARFAWYVAVAAIMIGHVVAVYLAHANALHAFGPGRVALRSQVPLTALMVVYTFVSLSILAEPMVERREPARPAAIAATGVAIPADAVLPVPGTGAFIAVGAGRFAKAKLTYRVLGSAFHDGTRTSVADLLYAYAFAYRWGSRSEAGNGRYDPYVDTASAAMRQQLAGLRAAEVDTVSRSFRIGDVNFVRELFAIDVYANVIPEDAERDGIIAPPWSTIPWHLIVLMEEAVERGWAAFSEAEAKRRQVEWLDLVRSGETNARLAELAATFEREAYRPAALQTLVNAEDARKRWTAILAFYKDRGHFLVTNGPYRLKHWSAESVTLEAFRDLTYPLGVGSYDAYAVPRRGYVTQVEQAANRVRLSGDIETVVKFARSHRIEREAIKSVARDVLKRAAPQCRYVVIDEEGRVALAGATGLADDLAFHVDFGGRLAAGRYTMFAMIAVNENAMNAEVRRIPLEISADR